MRRNNNALVTVLNGVQTTGWKTAAINVADFRHKTVIIATSGMAAGDIITIKVGLSNADSAPTFGSAAAYNNLWGYARFRSVATSGNLNLGTLYTNNGVTLTYSDSQFIEHFAVEDDNAKWMNVQVSALTDGDSSAYIYAYISMANDSE